LIDDSLVRGTTSKKIVKMMRDAGANEVHLHIASPPITRPDYYGIDMRDRASLLAADHTLEEMRHWSEPTRWHSYRSTGSIARWASPAVTRPI
jgi:amidophosphoribosyltransferase